jgi:hypothetical protein
LGDGSSSVNTGRVSPRGGVGVERPKEGAVTIVFMRAFFHSQVRLFALHQGRDAVRYLAPARGPEFAAAARFPEIPVHRTLSAFSVRAVAAQKDSLFVAAHQIAGFDLLRLPLDNSRIGFLRAYMR